MDGKDASGRMVSLLNYNPRPKLPYPRLSDHSRALSYSTQTSRDDSYSPRTPQLVRSDTASSQSIMDIPSPTTPTYPFEPLEQPNTIDPYNGCYPTSAYLVPRPGDYDEQPYYQLSTGHDRPVEDGYEEVRPHSRHTSLTSPSNPIAPTAPQATSKLTTKNKYPCPHASRFNCADTFTTSGHATRHGKKHTGEKNIICPNCDKAFTRKDNMKQHQRTHQGRRDSGKTLKERDEMRRQKAKIEQQARIGEHLSQAVFDIGTDTEEIATIEDMDSEDRSRSSLTAFNNSSGLKVVTTSSYGHISADLESPSGRLDALAMAASGMSFSRGGTRRHYQSDECTVY